MQYKSLKIVVILCLLFASKNTLAQHWAPLGTGTNSAVTYVYSDSTNNELYVGGSFSKANGSYVNGIAEWNGTSWHDLNRGMDIGFGFNTVSPIIRYKNYIIASGGFDSAGGVYSPYISGWDGTTWHSFNGQPNGVVTNMLVYNNELYVCGTLDSLGKVNAHGIGKWDGNNWHSLGLPNWLHTDNDIYGMAFYNDTLYISGLITDTVGNLHYLAWYDGTDWHYFQDDIKFAFESFPYQLAVYNGELYVGGDFTTQAGNYGNYIQRWNGTQWHDVGGGTDGAISQLNVIDGKLYAVGGFEHAGGIPADGIAYWDGTEWCGLGSQFNSGISSVALYNDTLYVGGGFSMVDGNAINTIAKWTGGNYVDTCGFTILGVNTPTAIATISIFPNPAHSYLELSGLPDPKTNLQYSIINTLGQTKQSNTLPPNNTLANINVSALPAGIYFIRLMDNNGFVYSAKFVKE